MVTWGPTASSEDGHEQVGTGWSGGADPIYAGVGPQYHGAWRFASVLGGEAGTVDTVDAGTQLIVTIDSVAGTPNVSVYGNDVDDAPAISTSAPTAWTRTTATTAIPAAPGTGSETIDVQAIIAEILARGGWSNGNDVALTAWDLDGGAGPDYFLISGGNDATLTVEYTLAGGGGGDPEGKLIGGKLVGNGLLGGRLVS